MPSLTWWIIHAIQEPAILLCVVLSMAACRRVGAYTPYGIFLFVTSLGFWFLLIGNLVFMARNVLGVWERPGTLADVFTLSGWAILVLAFILLAIWFPARTGRPGASWRPILALATLGAFAVLVLAFGLLSRPGQDPTWTIRAYYLLADGVGMGALAAGGSRILRLRQSSLGKLYLFLGAALSLKTFGDLTWVYLAARQLAPAWASAVYPIAGGLAVTGFLLHYHDVRKDSYGLRQLDEPWIRTEQRILRDFIHQLRGLAGGHAAHTVLLAAVRPLQEAGVAANIRNDTLYARADAQVWAQVLEAAATAAQASLGEVAQQRIEQIQAAYANQERPT